VLYTADIYIYPDVDALDTALLQGYTAHVTAVRRAGLESQFRAPGVTAFVASNDLYDAGPGRLQANPGPFLLFNATETSIPDLGPVTFTALDGSTRSIREVACPDGSDPDNPRDDLCSPYQFEDATQIYEGLASGDRTGILHVLRTLSYPPGF
jgi:hypothetical protein